MPKILWPCHFKFQCGVASLWKRQTNVEIKEKQKPESDWLTDWHNHLLIDWQTNWQTNWNTHLLTDSRLTNFRSNSIELIDSLIDSLTHSLTHLLMTDWLTHWLTHWLQSFPCPRWPPRTLWRSRLSPCRCLADGAISRIRLKICQKIVIKIVLLNMYEYTYTVCTVLCTVQYCTYHVHISTTKIWTKNSIKT